MNKDIFLLFQLCYLALFMRLMYLWLDGFYDRRSFIDGVKIILVLILGTSVAAFATSRIGRDIEQIQGIICDRKAANLWMCGGWPIFGDFYGEFLGSIRSGLLSFMSLPALTAPLIANLYVARKIAEVKKLEGWELVRILGASFIIYFSLTNSAHLLSAFDALMKIIGGSADRAAEGQRMMAQWVSTINQYLEVMPQISLYNKPWSLGIALGLFAILVSLGSTMLYVYQLYLVAMVPMHFFNGLLADKTSIMPGIRKLAAIAGLGALNGPLWLFFSKMPKLTSPQLIGGTLAYSDADYYALVGIVALAIVVFFVYYLALFFMCIRIIGGLFSGASNL